VDPAPATGDRGPGGEGTPLPRVRQIASAYDAAQQAVLGSGVQNVYLGGREWQPESLVSIALPVGLRDESVPLRGRDGLLDEVAAPGGERVRVLHGLGGCGKTWLALEAAYRAQQRGMQVWWVSAAGPDSLAAGMRAVGRRLGATDAQLEHGDAADLIWQRLRGRPDPWLLVIDNADDPQILAGAGAGASVVEGRDGCSRCPGTPGWSWSRAGTAARRVGDRGVGCTGWGCCPPTRRRRCWPTTPVIIRAWAA